MKIGVFEQILYEVDASPVPECITGMDIMSDCRLLPLPNTVKQKAHKPLLRPVLIGHAKGTPLELPGPARVVKVKQYAIPGGRKEVTTLTSDMLKAGGLMPTDSESCVACAKGVWLMEMNGRLSRFK